MVSIEKVVKGFEQCWEKEPNTRNCNECPYLEYRNQGRGKSCADRMHLDALELMKEQKERKDWISVKDDMPVELHSIFWRFLGTGKWSNAMWREQSDKVLVAVEFADGTRRVTTGETHDGKWRTSISPTIPHLVTHWMKMPDLPLIR